jgi:predicted CXXCH cytochrome family protein
MRPILGVVLIGVLTLSAWAALAQTAYDPHSDPNSGVLRLRTEPPTRGQCRQCHATHEDSPNAPVYPIELFTENTNRIAFWDLGDGPCHRDRPQNYPLGEMDRMPDTEPDPGYFEANNAGVRRVGVELRGRWPGENVYANPSMTPQGRYYSPHAQDPDMPRRDALGQGMCLNCHDPHGGTSRRDLLLMDYGGIGGHASLGAPPEYQLCFNCHGHSGPGGMDPASTLIEDYYDRGLNGRRAGHQIRRNRNIAISWPSYILSGDSLPCYNCHNPHGSEGNNGVQPNAFLISDERTNWSGLTNTLNDAAQCRKFCFGCHIASNGIPGTQSVEGIVMNTLPDESPHRSTATKSCHDCHGRDYSSPTSRNVHNPDGG